MATSRCQQRLNRRRMHLGLWWHPGAATPALDYPRWDLKPEKKPIPASLRFRPSPFSAPVFSQAASGCFENMAPRNFGWNSWITSLDQNKRALADWGLDNAAHDSGGSLRWDGMLLLTRGCPHLILSSLPDLPVLDLKPRGTLDTHGDSSPYRPQIPLKLKGILKDKGKGIIIVIWKLGIRKTAERAKKRSPVPAQHAPDGSRRAGADGRAPELVTTAADTPVSSPPHRDGLPFSYLPRTSLLSEQVSGNGDLGPGTQTRLRAPSFLLPWLLSPRPAL